MGPPPDSKSGGALPPALPAFFLPLAPCSRFAAPQTQYLYETYPEVVSPIEGVLNEHFIVWMRTAGLPRFRKLYGKIEEQIEPPQVLTFNITASEHPLGNARFLVISVEFDGRRGRSDCLESRAVFLFPAGTRLSLLLKNRFLCGVVEYAARG